MKVRSGFVSNSSSSSFILSYTDVFDVFGIGKKEIIEAISSLSSMKAGEGFQVFDLSCEKSKACKSFGGLLENYNQTFIDSGRWSLEKDNAKTFKSLLDAVEKIGYYCLSTGDDAELDSIDKLSSCIKDTIRIARQKLEIKTAYEVMLDDENAAIAIHFDDNAICNIDGMDFDEESNEHHKYESPAYSCSRFIEILFTWLVEHNYIDPKKKELLEKYPLAECYKKAHPGQISWLDDDTYTWKDYADEGVLHAVFHEG